MAGVALVVFLGGEGSSQVGGNVGVFALELLSHGEKEVAIGVKLKWLVKNLLGNVFLGKLFNKVKPLGFWGRLAAFLRGFPG